MDLEAKIDYLNNNLDDDEVKKEAIILKIFYVIYSLI